LKYKIAIIHALFDSIGGTESLALHAASALLKNGFDTDIITATDVNKEKIKSILNVDYSDIRFIKINLKKLNFLAMLTSNRSVRLRRIIMYNKIFSKEYLRYLYENYNLVIDTQSNLITPVDITYIHFPVTMSTFKGTNFKIKIYNFLIHYNSKKFSKSKSGRVITNSKWTANKIYKEFNVIPDVVYPPVNVEDFLKISYNGHKEKNIITVSRFSPEKGLDKILNLASKFPDYNFYLIGSTVNGLSDQLINQLQNEIKNENLKNVYLLPNYPRNEMIKLMSESKIYLHPPFAEHFGISIVESMASGLIPVVYKDGGGWTDIVSNIDKNLGYDETNWEYAIKYAIENEQKLREKSVEFSKNFSKEKFEERFLNIINYVLQIKEL
jgi:glycosyltransferase involved in cell wall biosynthesis